MSKRTTIFATAGAFIVGIGLASCAGGGGDDKAAAAPAPAPTVTVTAEPEVETVEVEVTPQECLDALDLADNAFTTASEVISAILANDVAGMESSNAELQEYVDPYNEAKTACRAAGN